MSRESGGGGAYRRYLRGSIEANDKYLYYVKIKNDIVKKKMTHMCGEY
jgi:hypothetical protein